MDKTCSPTWQAFTPTQRQKPGFNGESCIEVDRIGYKPSSAEVERLKQEAADAFEHIEITVRSCVTSDASAAEIIPYKEPRFWRVWLRNSRRCSCAMKKRRSASSAFSPLISATRTRAAPIKRLPAALPIGARADGCRAWRW